jgi:hypothetical protein
MCGHHAAAARVTDTWFVHAKDNLGVDVEEVESLHYVAEEDDVA